MIEKQMHNARSAIVLLFIGMVVFSCRSGFENPDNMQLFRYNEDLNITSLDPVYARNQANIWGVAQLFNSLVELDDSLHIKPAIARSWDISEDGLTYTFTLRDDVFFHDDICFTSGKGRRVIASDVVFSLNRLIDLSLNSPGAWVMNQVARLEDGSLAAFALNDSTFVLKLSSPFPPMMGLLSMQYCAIVPHEAITYHGRDFRRNPVGTGPFRFSYWKEGVKLVYLRNEAYFEYDGNYRLPYLDAISISFIKDRQTAFLEFIKGNLDMLTRVDASYKDELLTPVGELQERYHDKLIRISQPFLNSEYLGILMNEERLSDDWPLRSKKVRQALNYGFDREKMLTFLRNNMGTPAHAGFVPVGMPGFTENKGGYHYDPDKAAQLLAEAGYPGGEGLPVITLRTNQAYQDIAQYIQFELARLGLRIDIDVMPPATLREMMANGEAPFFRGSWIADYPDAENYLALFYSANRSPSGPNYTHFSNTTFDSLYEASQLITSDEERFAIYRKMDALITEEAPKVFLFYDQSNRFVHKQVENMTNNPLNHLILKRVRINN